MQLPAKAIRAVWFWRAAMLVMPFLVFYWLCPVDDGLVIGNDYTAYCIPQQLEAMFSLRNGSFPLFIPDFWYGQSLAALTQSQFFHPLVWGIALVPGYWQGAALDLYTAAKLLSLGLAHIALFGALRRWRLAPDLAFVGAAFTVYNMRMLDLFRYAASLESYTGYLFLVSALIAFQQRRKSRAARASIVLATYWILASGHPQMAYYVLIGCAAFAGILPLTRPLLEPGADSSMRICCRFWLETTLWVVAGVLLASAYTFPFIFEFLAANISRAQRDYAWATEYTDSARGLLNIFFLPLLSDVHGSFGGSALMLVALTALFLPVERRRLLPHAAVLCAIGIPLLLACGAMTPLHKFVWTYVPFYSAGRAPGRILVVVPPFLLLAWALAVRARATCRDARTAKTLIHTFLAAAGIALLLYVAYPVTLKFGSLGLAYFIPRRIQGLSLRYDIIGWALGTMCLTATLMRVWRPANRAFCMALCMTVVLQVAFLMRHGTWVAPRAVTPPPRTFEEIREDRARGIGIGENAFGMESDVVTAHHAAGLQFDTQMARLYDTWIITRDVGHAYELIASRDLSHETLVVTPTDAGSAPASAPPRGTAFDYDVRCTHYSYNRIEFDVSTSKPALLKLNYPYSGYWRASVDRTPTPVLRANGAECALQVKKGRSRIEFRYRSPSSFWGVLVSCATLFAVSAILFVPTRPTIRARRFAMVVVGAAAIAIFATWRISLYRGRDLQTSESAFHWRSGQGLLNTRPRLSGQGHGKRSRTGFRL
ncbi:MAG: hypothetical protein O3B84_03515 [Chloroflexi bacterium]|nr:hypothetical protein [Chloroflexota bacterium]